VKGIAAVSTTAVTIPTSGTQYQLAELTLPAGILNSAARIIRFYAAGNYSTGPGGSGSMSLTFRLKLCSVSGCGSGAVLTLATWGGTGNTTASVTNAWKVDGEVATNTTGSSGNLLTHGMSFVQLGATGSALTPETRTDNNTAASAAIDLTAALYLNLTISPNASNASNSAVAHMFTVSPIN